MMTTNELMQHALALAREFDENFLGLARTLRLLNELDPDEFRRAVKLAGFGPRKGYCLIAIDRKFGSLPISKVRLRKVGWTKLNLLTRHVTEQNCADLLQLAEKHTAKELEAILLGQDPEGKRRAVLLYLSQDAFDMFENVLLSFGAVRAGRGLANREVAVMELTWWAYEQLAELADLGDDVEIDGDGEDCEVGDDDVDLGDGGPMQVVGFDDPVPPDPVQALLVRMLAKAHAQRDHLQEQVAHLTKLVATLNERNAALLNKHPLKDYLNLDEPASNDDDASPIEP